MNESLGTTETIYLDRNKPFQISKIQVKISTLNDAACHFYTGIHELSHTITLTSFNQNKKSVYLTPSKKVSWTPAIEERIASGTRFLGENPFYKQGTVPAIGWITENIGHLFSNTNPRLYYPDRDALKVASESFYIPKIFIPEEFENITLATSKYFQNYKQVLMYLNDIQKRFQILRIKKQLIEYIKLEKKSSLQEQEQIIRFIDDEELDIHSNIEKLADAVIQANYIKVLEIDSRKFLPSYMNPCIIDIVNSAFKLAFNVISQIDNGMIASRFYFFIRNKIIEQYSPFINEKFSRSNARAAVATRVHRHSVKLNNDDMPNLSDCNNPYGRLKLDINVSQATLYRKFVQELNLPETLIIFASGTSEDYEKIMHFFKMQIENGVLSKINVAQKLVNSVTNIIKLIFQYGGNINSLIESLLEYYSTATTTEKQLFKPIELQLSILVKAQKTGKHKIELSTSSREKLSNLVTHDLKLPRIDSLTISDSGQIQYFDSTGKTVTVIHDFNFETPENDSYFKIFLADNYYIYLHKSDFQKSFLVTTEVVKSTQWLVRDDIPPTRENIISSVRYYRALLKSQDHFIIQTLFISKIKKLLIQRTQSPNPDTTITINILLQEIINFSHSVSQDHALLSRLYESIDNLFKNIFYIENPMSLGIIDINPSNISFILKCMGHSGFLTVLENAINTLGGSRKLKSSIISILADKIKNQKLLNMSDVEIKQFLETYDTSKLPADLTNTFNDLKQMYKTCIEHQSILENLLLITGEKLLKIDKLNINLKHLSHFYKMLTGAMGNYHYDDLFTFFSNIYQAQTLYSQQIRNNLTQNCLDVLYDYRQGLSGNNFFGLLAINQNITTKFILNGQIKLLNEYLKSNTPIPPEHQSPLLKIVSEHGIDYLAHISKSELKIIIKSHLNLQHLSIKSDWLLTKAYNTLAIIDLLACHFSSTNLYKQFAQHWAEALIDTDISQIEKIYGPQYSPHHIELLENMLKDSSEAYHEKILIMKREIGIPTSIQKTTSALLSSSISYRLSESTTHVQQENGLSNDWVPILESVHKVAADSYEMQMMNTTDLHKEDTVKTILTTETSFIETKDFLEKNTTAIAQGILAKTNKNSSSSNIPVEAEPEPVSTLNSAMAIQALMSFIQQQNSFPHLKGHLARVVQVQAYVNLTRVLYGAAIDIYHATQLVISLSKLNNAAEATNLMSAASSMALGGLDGLLSLASTGLDIYQLTKTTTDSQKAIIGTQLFFDGSSVVLGGVSLGLGIASMAGFTAAATAAAYISGPAVIFAGIGIGVTGLVEAFSEVENNVDGVAKFFGEIEKTYAQQGFEYDKKINLLKSTGLGIVKKIDFKKNEVTFGSHYLYSTKRGHTDHVAKSQYIFWSGDFPKCDQNNKHLISVRKALKYPEKVEIDEAKRKADIVTLPSSPLMSAISYEWNQTPGATIKKKEGYSTLRKLQHNAKFDALFVVAVPEYAIDKIHETPEPFNIKVVLDKHARVLVLPAYPKDYNNVVSHTIIGDGGQYQISLNDKANIYLHNNSKQKDNWIINYSNTTSQIPYIEDNSISFGDAKVTIDNKELSNIIVTTKNGDLYEINWNEKLLKLISVNGEINDPYKNNKQQRQNLLSQLQKLSYKTMLNPVTKIDNYHYNDSKTQTDKIIKKAYFIEKLQQFIFTDELSESAYLLNVLDSDDNEQKTGKNNKEFSALFFDPTTRTINQIDSISHKIIKTYAIPKTIEPTSVISANVINKVLYANIVKDKKHTALDEHIENYLLSWQNEHFVLNSIINNEYIYNSIHKDQIFDFKCIEAIFKDPISLGKILTINMNNKTPRFINTFHKQPIVPKFKTEKPNLILLNNDLSDSSKNSSTNLTDNDNNFNVSALLQNPPMKNLYYFDHTDKSIHVQNDPLDTIQQVTIEQGKNFSTTYITDNGINATTDKGLVWQLTNNKQHRLIGVNKTWIYNQKDWLNSLKDLSRKYNFTSNKDKTVQIKDTAYINNSSQNLISVKGLSQDFLTGYAFFLGKSASSLLDAENAIKNIKGAEYKVDRVDFFQSQKTKNTHDHDSLSDFLGTNAHLINSHAAKHVNKKTVHVVSGDIWLNDSMHKLDFIYTGGIGVYINGVNALNSSNEDTKPGKNHDGSNYSQIYYKSSYTGKHQIKIIYFNSGYHDSKLNVKIDDNTLDQQKDSIPILCWFHPSAKKFIFTNIENSSGNLSLLNTDKSSAWIYDNIQQKIYYQPLISTDKMSALKENTTISYKQINSILPKTEDVLTQNKIEYVQQNIDGTSFITDNGLELCLNVTNNSLTIKSANKSFIDNINNFKTKHIKLNDLITVYSSNTKADKQKSIVGIYLNTPIKQFYFSHDDLFKNSADKNLINSYGYLGINNKEQEIFIVKHRDNNSYIYSIGVNNHNFLKNLGVYKQAQVFKDDTNNTTLLLQDVKNEKAINDILISTDNLYVTINNSLDNLAIGQKLLNNYKKIIIAEELSYNTAINDNKKDFQIKLTEQIIPTNCYVTLNKNQLIITDIKTNKQITIQLTKNGTFIYKLQYKNNKINIKDVVNYLHKHSDTHKNLDFYLLNNK